MLKQFHKHESVEVVVEGVCVRHQGLDFHDSGRDAGASIIHAQAIVLFSERDDLPEVKSD